MKNDQRNIYFLELLIEPISKKVNLNIGMDDIIGKFEDCLTSSNNSFEINKGTESLILRDIRRSENNDYCTLLIGLTNPKAQDSVYTDPDNLQTQRKTGKKGNEVGEIGCHVVIKLAANDVSKQSYSVLLEEVSGLNRSLVGRLLNKLLADEHRRLNSKLFEAPDNSGAMVKGRPKLIGYRPKITLTGIPSDEFIASIENGNISMLTLMEPEVITPFGQQAYLKPKKHTFEFSIDKTSAPDNLWTSIKTALKEKSVNWAAAKITFEDDYGRTGTAHINSNTGTIIKNSFTKRLPLLDINPPLADSADLVVAHLSDSMIDMMD